MFAGPTNNKARTRRKNVARKMERRVEQNCGAATHHHHHGTENQRWQDKKPALRGASPLSPPPPPSGQNKTKLLPSFSFLVVRHDPGIERTRPRGAFRLRRKIIPGTQNGGEDKVLAWDIVPIHAINHIETSHFRCIVSPNASYALHVYHYRNVELLICTSYRTCFALNMSYRNIELSIYRIERVLPSMSYRNIEPTTYRIERVLSFTPWHSFPFSTDHDRKMLAYCK